MTIHGSIRFCIIMICMSYFFVTINMEKKNKNDVQDAYKEHLLRYVKSIEIKHSNGDINGMTITEAKKCIIGYVCGPAYFLRCYNRLMEKDDQSNTLTMLPREIVCKIIPVYFLQEKYIYEQSGLIAKLVNRIFSIIASDQYRVLELIGLSPLLPLWMERDIYKNIAGFGRLVFRKVINVDVERKKKNVLWNKPEQILFNETGSKLFLAEKSCIVSYGVKKNEQEKSVYESNLKSVKSFALHPNNRCLIAVGLNNAIAIIDLIYGKLQTIRQILVPIPTNRTYSYIQHPAGPIALFSKSGNKFFYGIPTNGVERLALKNEEWKTEKESPRNINARGEYVGCNAYSPNIVCYEKSTATYIIKNVCKKNGEPKMFRISDQLSTVGTSFLAVDSDGERLSFFSRPTQHTHLITTWFSQDASKETKKTEMNQAILTATFGGVRARDMLVVALAKMQLHLYRPRAGKIDHVINLATEDPDESIEVLTADKRGDTIACMTNKKRIFIFKTSFDSQRLDEYKKSFYFI